MGYFFLHTLEGGETLGETSEPVDKIRSLFKRFIFQQFIQFESTLVLEKVYIKI